MTLRLTEQDLADIQRRQSAWRAPTRAVEPRKERRDAVAPKRGMNAWEAEFASQLEARKAAGEITWWAFEPIRIRLASGAWYKPDFVTVDKHHRTEVYEVKGKWEEAARVRFKVAVEKLPYQFYIVRKHKGELRVTKV